MILVAGIGNIFLGDDAFGSEVARRLQTRSLPEGVRVEDFGIRGFDLMYALLDAYDRIIILDTTPGGGIPGTLYVLEPGPTPAAGGLDAHGMDPVRVLEMARSMGADFSKVRILGCEPESFGPPDEGRLGLSSAVEAAIDPAIALVESLIQEALV